MTLGTAVPLSQLKCDIPRLQLCQSLTRKGWATRWGLHSLLNPSVPTSLSQRQSSQNPANQLQIWSPADLHDPFSFTPGNTILPIVWHQKHQANQTFTPKETSTAQKCINRPLMSKRGVDAEHRCGRVSVPAPKMRDEQKLDTSNWPVSEGREKHRSGHS